MASGDILFFSGQGSECHFSDKEALDQELDHLGEDGEEFMAFMIACKRAFHESHESLSEDEKTIFPDDTPAGFEKPGSLLFPDTRFRTHPVIETTTLYLRQILGLYLYRRRSRSLEAVQEVNAVCTGIFPAIIAASLPSQLSTDFLSQAIEGFRLAFWLGVRISLWCRDRLGDGWGNQPWLLTVFKACPRKIVESVQGYNARHPVRIISGHPRGDRSLQAEYLGQKDGVPLRISALLDDDTVSISGPGPGLAAFQSRLSLFEGEASSRWGHVHGYYHGGDEMNLVVDQVMVDADRCGIRFPSWPLLHCPIRSATSGGYMTPDNAGPSLLRAALRSIFVEAVDWKKTLGYIGMTYSSTTSINTYSRFRFIGLGPNTKMLLKKAYSTMRAPNIQVMESFSEELVELESDCFAIVGASANFPSGKGLEELWSTIIEAKSAAEKIPISRFNVSEYYKTDSQQSPKSRSMGTMHGNFLRDPFEFDAEYFNISPREAKSMDPQQRLLLHAAIDALEDAGYFPSLTSGFDSQSFGVYIGVATGDYVDNLRHEIDVYYSPGTLRAFLSGRISYVLGFQGPSMVIDTACSSSMVSLYHACRALRAGDCKAALAGGVNVISSPDMFLGLSRAHFLSPTGQCKPFDAHADGYCRAEGCGLVVVKRFSQALEDNDHIYALIRGVEVNQCGKAKSITHPDSTTQAALLSRVLDRSKVRPESIDVVEAHGTGTQAGDAAEISSLATVFRRDEASSPLHVSSIKGNIGHTEAASGIASLIKLILMLEKGKIAPQASFQTPNPKLKMAAQGLVVPTAIQDWKSSKDHPRRALLSNFGASGSNTALVLEETPQWCRPRAMSSHPRSFHVLCLSAKSAAALSGLKERFTEFIHKNPNTRLENLCYSANARRRHHDRYRWTGGGTNLSQILDRLQAGGAKEKPSVLHEKTKSTIFLFSGQGGSYKGMGSELLRTAPEFRLAVETCDSILESRGFLPTISYIDSGTFDDLADTAHKGHNVTQQCACFVLEYALARLWTSFGIIPDLVFGHSLGEYAAMVVAEILSLQEALIFVATRAELMRSKLEAQSSGMLACKTSLAEASTFLQQQFRNVERGPTIACVNSPGDCVIAGSLSDLSAVADYFEDKGIRCKLLDLPYGFHSWVMDPIKSQLEVLSSTVSLRKPSIRFGSSVYGRLLDTNEGLSSKYLVEQTRNPVQFLDLMQSLDDDLLNGQYGAHILEVGPSPITLTMGKSSLRSDSNNYLPTLRRSEQPWVTISSTLQSLYMHCCNIQWPQVYRGSEARFQKDIPRYPLQGQNYLTPYQEPMTYTTNEVLTGDTVESEKGLEFVRPADKQTSSGIEDIFRIDIKRMSKLIQCHVVGGVPLCPASVFFEVALEGISVRDTSAVGPFCFSSVNFEHPLVHSSTDVGILQIELCRMDSPAQATTTQFAMKNPNNNHSYCSGCLSKTVPRTLKETLSRKTAYVKRQITISLDEQKGKNLEVFTRRTIYDVIFPRVVAYGNDLKTLEQLALSPQGFEALGVVRLPDTSEKKFVYPPALTDTILHAAGFIANTKADFQTACICVSIERLILPDWGEFLRKQDYGIYCSIVDSGNEVMAEAYVLNDSRQVIAFADGICFKKVRLQSFKSILLRSTTAKSQSMGQSENVSVEACKKLSFMQAGASKPSRPQQNVADVVKELLETVCGISEDIADRSLFELGVDSLLFIELANAIGARFPEQRIQKHDLDSCLTAHDLIRLITDATATGPSASSSELLSAACNFDLNDSSSSDSLSTKSPATPSEDCPPGSDPDFMSQLDALFLELCGFSASMTDNAATLGSLGIDSLLSIEFVQELKSQFNINIQDKQSALSEMTIREIQDLLTKMTVVFPESSSLAASHENMNRSKHQSDNLLITDLIPKSFPDAIEKPIVGTLASPLYLFHDGSGLSSMYSKLGKLGRSLYGIFSLDLATIDTSIMTMEDLATVYIKLAHLMEAQEPILGGWSFGGVLALEVAKQLSKAGRPIKGLILIDSPVPLDHEPLPDDIISELVGSKRQGRLATTANQARLKLEAQFKRHARLLSNYCPNTLKGEIPCVSVVCKRTVDTQSLYGVDYPWLQDEAVRKRAFDDWEQILGTSISVLEIDCNHFEVFDPENIEEMTLKLIESCEVIDRKT